MFAAARPETGVRHVDMRYAAVVRARADTASDRCVSAIGIGSAIIIIIIIIGPIIAIIISILRSSSGSSLLGGAVPARDMAEDSQMMMEDSQMDFPDSQETLQLGDNADDQKANHADDQKVDNPDDQKADNADDQKVDNADDQKVDMRMSKKPMTRKPTMRTTRKSTMRMAPPRSRKAPPRSGVASVALIQLDTSHLTCDTACGSISNIAQIEQLKEHMEARAPAVGQSSAPRSEYVKWAEGVLTRAALRFYSLQSHGI